MSIPRRYRRPTKLTNPPVISIVTPTFNMGSFLERTMLSVLDQGYPRLEYVVQDGGSTDETEDVLGRHADRLHHFEMRPDDGHAHAINLGFEHTTGGVMAFLNSDDILLPGALHYVGRYFERHPEVELVYGHRVLVDENDMEIGRWVLPRHDDGILGWADFIPQETMFWRRRLWERTGGYMDQRWPFALDWELLIRFKEARARTVRLPRFLGGFRIHEAQKTSAIMDTQGGTEMAGLRQRVHGREVTREEVRAAVRPYMFEHIVLHRLYRAHLLRY
jgi:glycosyltransferase involved in cell wall biosynthesis